MIINEFKININTLIFASTFVKCFLALLITVFITAIGFYIDTISELKELTRLKTETIILNNTLIAQYNKTLNYEELSAQNTVIEAAYKNQMKALLGQNQIANQLIEISKICLDQGLQLVLFKPNTQVIKAFYSELPIAIKINGTYEEISQFIQGLTALPNVVTLEEINLKSLSTQSKITLSAVLKIYSQVLSISCIPSISKDIINPC